MQIAGVRDGATTGDRQIRIISRVTPIQDLSMDIIWLCCRWIGDIID